MEVSDVLIWAHRGASGYAPENTLEAFKLAMEMGADGLELDVQLTKDGELVVIHDETLQRVSNVKGYVKDYTLAQLKKLNVNKNFPIYGEVQIPTLGEVLELLAQTEMQLNIELKTGSIFYQGIEEQAISLVEQYGMQKRVWYSSFNHYSVRKVKVLKSQVKVGLLCSDCMYEPADYAIRFGAEALHPSVRSLQYPGYLESCKRAGLRVHAWTVNSYKDFRFCMQGKVDAVITNYPDKARVLMQKQGEKRYPFENPFTMEAGRSFYLFGAGDVGRHFLKKYADKYIPEFILDNAREKWGSIVEGITVVEPQKLKSGDCVIIASIYYTEIVKQLKNLGVYNYYIYDETSDWE